jgi:GntR family transcriptional regulator, transcriptional repressor for pyruvate dehydrogenase complex
MPRPVVQKVRRVRFGVVGNKSALVDRVVHAIQEQILSEHLAVGTKLPPEREFAVSLGVSRTVVREAVRVLAASGLLETSHGIGTTVRALSREEVVRPLNLFLRSWGRDVSLIHLHQVRSLLEVENIGLAAEHASEDDIKDLRRILEEMEAAKEDPVRFAVKDSDFHRRLAQTTHNPLLTLLLDSIHDLMVEIRELVAKESGLVERVMPAHVEMLDCIEKRDARRARRAMREHLAAALDVQKRAILSSPEEIQNGAKH